MRLAFLALALAMASPAPAFARHWTSAELADLETEASRAPEEGLPPPAPYLERLALWEHLYDLDEIYGAGLDAAADALLVELAGMYAHGAVDPATVGADWHIERPPAPPLATMGAWIDAGASPGILLRSLLPQGAEYAALRDALAQLQQDGLTSEERAAADQLRANMERWRWMPRTLPVPRVEVRLAQFELFVHREAQPDIAHKVIVGAPHSPSPVFNAEIETITPNPSWTPPTGIVLNELVPRFRRNPSAAAREGYEVIDQSGAVVDPAHVNWRARPFPYQLRQRPGSDNALGQIRFDLPNPFAVYLHDTPSRRLFDRSNRALSHGCIRVQDPVALAAELVGTPDWAQDALQGRIDQGETASLPLPAPVPVFVLYFTTALDDAGAVTHLDDIYRRDHAIVAALDSTVQVADYQRQGLCSP